MFAYLIQEWREEPTCQLNFFIDSMRIQKLLGLSALSNDKRFPPRSSYPEILLESVLESNHAYDHGVLLVDYMHSVSDLLLIFYSSRKQLTISQILQRRKYLDSKQKNSNLVVDTNIDCLTLLNKSLGPLIIPGPSFQGNLHPSENNPVFIYQQNWPDLDRLQFVLSERSFLNQPGMERFLSLSSKIESQVWNLLSAGN
jgi:hypothetical protein